MRLLFEIVTPDYDPTAPAIIRPSARGILLRDGKVAMVYSQKYDYYKFPGGGIEGEESPTDALLREVREEAGLLVRPETVREYGLVHRAHPSPVTAGKMFVQDNLYYLCQAEDRPAAQDLDDYEREEGFILRWTDPDTAIAVNRRTPHGPKDQRMIEREARVLELLKEEGYL